MWLDKAEVLFEQENFKLAFEYYTEYLKSEPNDLYCLCRLAICHAQLNRKEACVEVLNDAFKGNSEDWFVNYLLSFYLVDDDIKSAKKHVEKCLALEPNSADSLYVSALLASAQNENTICVERCQEGLAVEPNHAALSRLLGTTLLSLGQLGRSKLVLEACLRKNPNDDYLHYVLGLIYLEQGKPNNAKNHFQKAILLNPQEPIYRDEVIESLKNESKLYRFFLKRGFAKYTFQVKFDFWLIIRVVFALKVLPLIIAVAIFYILVCWYCNVWYEVYLKTKQLYRHLLNEKKTIRIKGFLVLNTAIVGMIYVSNLYDSTFLWRICWLLILSVFYFVSWFEIEKTSGRVVFFTFLSLLLLAMLPQILFSSGESLLPIIVGIAITGLYGAIFSVNGVK